MKQEAANKELQRQLAALQDAQAAALQAALAGGEGEGLGPADLAAMRQQLVLAQAQLHRQAEELEAARADYDARQALLKEAAGAPGGGGGKGRLLWSCALCLRLLL